MKPRRRAGYTLLEIFIVCVLLAVMLFALIGLYPAAMVSVRKGTHMVAASDLAQESIDSALSAPSPGTTSTVVPVDGVDYRVVRTVTLLTPAPGPRNTYEISVQVLWQAGDGPTLSSVQFQTIQYDFVNPQ